MVMYHHTKGMEQGCSSKNGQSGNELTMMSKQHCIDKWMINKETCKVMAGFDKMEGYYVLRAYLELLMPIDNLVLLFFHISISGNTNKGIGMDKKL